VVESHVTSHSPPEQSTAHGVPPLHVPLHAPPEQPQLPAAQGSGLDGVPGGIGSGSLGGPELHANSNKNVRRCIIRNLRRWESTSSPGSDT
jgi:hypothetical protein